MNKRHSSKTKYSTKYFKKYHPKLAKKLRKSFNVNDNKYYKKLLDDFIKVQYGGIVLQF